MSNEVSLQLLDFRSLEIQGNAFGVKSGALMTSWHMMMMICSEAVHFSPALAVLHLGKEGWYRDTGKPCEET